MVQPVGNYLRARGEYLPWWAGLLFERELPPRTRRIPPTRQNNIKHRGTTSAHAENTRAANKPLGNDGNYLRARGEYL